MIKRRSFMTLLGGAAAGWPVVAQGQQPVRVRRVGVLLPAAMNDSEYPSLVGAFQQGLRELGWTDGGNLRIDYRWGANNTNDIRKYAIELVALAPDVIMAPGSAAAGPLLQVTRTVPIVFTIVPDPVGAGFVDSLARPGGNATGFTSFESGIGGKWLELLKELAPRMTRVAVIRDSAKWRLILTLCCIGRCLRFLGWQPPMRRRVAASPSPAR